MNSKNGILYTQLLKQFEHAINTVLTFTKAYTIPVTWRQGGDMENSLLRNASSNFWDFL